MSEPCEFLSLDSCQKRVLWTHREVDLALHPVVGLVLHVGGAEKFPEALVHGSLDPFFTVSKQRACFTAIDGGDKRLVHLELAFNNIIIMIIITIMKTCKAQKSKTALSAVQ